MSALSGLVVLDEIERRPDIFPLLRVLADRTGRPATFLLLGSASPALWRGASESLAGRVAFHVVDGFGLDEVGKDRIERLWLRGIKRTSAPAVSKSIRVVLDDLHLDRVDVVHSGDETYPLTDRVRALAASRVLADLEPL